MKERGPGGSWDFSPEIGDPEPPKKSLGDSGENDKLTVSVVQL